MGLTGDFTELGHIEDVFEADLHMSAGQHFHLHVGPWEERQVTDLKIKGKD